MNSNRIEEFELEELPTMEEFLLMEEYFGHPIQNDDEYQKYRDKIMDIKTQNTEAEPIQTQNLENSEIKKEVEKPIDFKLEIERKFLLKNLPILYLKKKKHTLINIEQYYFLNDGVWERYRVSTDAKGIKFHKTIKKYISAGVCAEGEVEIKREDFEAIKNNVIDKKQDYKLIEKTRFVIEFKGLKFEIDVYQGLRIITMEVELPSIDFTYSTPKELQELILIELTGMPEFSNLNLAKDIKIKELTEKGQYVYDHY